MKKYIVELIGTFFLVLAIIAAINGGLGTLAPIAIGSTLMVMVYAGGHISGAHYNPAVSIAIYLRGRLPLGDLLPYIVFQILGALLASISATYILGFETEMGSIHISTAFLSEAIGTFALTFVILNVATAKSTEGNSFYGLAIGFTVTAMAYVFGGISGGVFNPAVAIGISLAGMSAWSVIWLFFAASIVGGVLATYVFKYVNGFD